MSRAHTIALGGMELVPDLSGALFIPDYRTLIAADLHFEKGSSLARRGVHLPPYDTRETLRHLRAVIAVVKPQRVILLGDSFHDEGARGRIDAADLGSLRQLAVAQDVVWITGNHDPKPPLDVGGTVAREVAIGPVVLRHEPLSLPGDGYEIAGHLHPAAAVAHRGMLIRRRCFIGNGRRVVMPAFGSYTGSLNILAEPFAELFASPDYFVWMLGNRAIHKFPAARLR